MYKYRWSKRSLWVDVSFDMGGCLSRSPYDCVHSLGRGWHWHGRLISTLGHQNEHPDVDGPLTADAQKTQDASSTILA